MRIQYEILRPTESMAIERTHSITAVKQLVKEVAQKAGGIKKEVVEVTLPFEPSRAELTSLRSRLLRHHGLEIVYQVRDEAEFIVFVQKYKRK